MLSHDITTHQLITFKHDDSSFNNLFTYPYGVNPCGAGVWVLDDSIWLIFCIVVS